jgi:hypothetical protein
MGQCGQGLELECVKIGEVMGYYWLDHLRLPKTKLIQIEAGTNHSLFLTSEGELLGCGGNEFYQLDSNLARSVWQPVQIEGMKNIRTILAGHMVTGVLVKWFDFNNLSIHNWWVKI